MNAVAKTQKKNKTLRTDNPKMNTTEPIQTAETPAQPENRANESPTYNELKAALLNLERADYEKVRKTIIADIGYDNFRALQNRIFKEIGTIKAEKQQAIKPVAFDSFVYNAADAKGHERGFMGKGKPKVSCVYSVYRIEDGIAFCQARNAWGEILEDKLPIETLEPYGVAVCD